MDIEKIKAGLLATLEELETRAKGIESRLSATPNPDWEENAKETEDNEVLDQLGDLTADELHHIKMALNRIENGTYGTCDSCHAKIAAERLAALPFATQCVKCA